MVSHGQRPEITTRGGGVHGPQGVDSPSRVCYKIIRSHAQVVPARPIGMLGARHSSPWEGPA